MRLFDLHCDTPFEMYKKSVALRNNGLHIDFDKASAFEQYGQVMAIWTENTLENEAAWTQFHRIYSDFSEKLKGENAVLCRTSANYSEAVRAGKAPIFLAVEGASLLCGDLSRLDTLYVIGVRFLTLAWKGESIIGGAYNTDLPLTPFGRAVVERCFSLGITVDVSHAGEAVISECLSMAEAAKKPIVATHSNYRALCSHPRNLWDADAHAIAKTGGLLGISLAPMHLDAMGQADIMTVCRHILHGLSLGLSESICLGCDFDGISKVPEGLLDISCLPRLYEALLSLGVPEAVVKDIFHGNAERFILSRL